MNRFLILVFLVIISEFSYGQILGGIMNSAKRKLQQKIEDKIVEAVSEELVRRAFKPIDEAIDSIMRQKFQDSINGGKEVDWDKMGQAYGEFLNGLNKAVDLPEKYTFDITQEVEVVDYSNKTNYLKLHYSKTDAVIGMENVDDADGKQFIVMDISRDAMVLFTTDKKGKKSAQVIPSVLKLSGALATSVQSDDRRTYNDIKIEKTGKKKKIAGFQSQEYKGNTKEEEMIMYVSENFPVQWQKSYTSYMSKFAPASYTENASGIESGFMLEYENSRKDEDKKTTWTTKKVSEKSFDILKKDYEFNTKEK